MSGQDFEGTIYPIKQKLASSRVEKTRLSNLRWVQKRKNTSKPNTDTTSWKRETKRLPRAEAREFARSFMKKYPKAAYWTEVESWRMLEGDIIEFTMRRLPSAD